MKATGWDDRSTWMDRRFGMSLTLAAVHEVDPTRVGVHLLRNLQWTSALSS
jgi:hypothetical protein